MVCVLNQILSDTTVQGGHKWLKNCVALFLVSGHSDHYYTKLFLVYIFCSFLFLFDFREMGGGGTGTFEIKKHGKTPA